MMRPRTAPQRGFSLDYLMWLFTRISALTMYLFAFTGIVAALVMGARQQMDLVALLRWGYMPNPFHIQSTDVIDTALYDNSFWKVLGTLFIFFAGTHGLNGLRVVLEDYLNPTWGRVLLRGLVFLIWLFMLIVGIYVLTASFTA